MNFKAKFKNLMFFRIDYPEWHDTNGLGELDGLSSSKTLRFRFGFGLGRRWRVSSCSYSFKIPYPRLSAGIPSVYRISKCETDNLLLAKVRLGTRNGFGVADCSASIGVTGITPAAAMLPVLAHSRLRRTLKIELDELIKRRFHPRDKDHMYRRCALDLAPIFRGDNTPYAFTAFIHDP
ncbi:hypothetical protein BDV19DRAFT_254023 [Aspergillus venezuelensis]